MRTVPLVFINLGGEMLYILEQRLGAHSTSAEQPDKGRAALGLSALLLPADPPV